MRSAFLLLRGHGQQLIRFAIKEAGVDLNALLHADRHVFAFAYPLFVTAELVAL